MFAKGQGGTEACHEVRPQAVEGDGPGLGRVVAEDVVVTGKEVRGDAAVAGDDLPVAGQDGRAVLQGDAGQGLGRRGAANAEIVLERLRAPMASRSCEAIQPTRRPGRP